MAKSEKSASCKDCLYYGDCVSLGLHGDSEHPCKYYKTERKEEKGEQSVNELKK